MHAHGRGGHRKRFSWSKMANNYGISDAELNVIKQQASRRADMRKEFIKQKTNPWKHAAESGYVFDPALQKFMSMKVTQFEYFQPNIRTSLIGIFGVVVPMFAYGYVLYKDRSEREHQIRTGELRYRDRLFKFA